jgi:YCII-related domain
MSSYVFVYRAPKGYDGGDSDTFAAWQAWFEGLGASIVDAGNPVFARETVGQSSSETLLGGYSLITADDLEAAVALARGCPTVAAGGGVEVGELTQLNVGSLKTTADDHAASRSA